MVCQRTYYPGSCADWNLGKWMLLNIDVNIRGKTLSWKFCNTCMMQFMTHIAISETKTTWALINKHPAEVSFVWMKITGRRDDLKTLNPILTGLFESKFLLGGGVNLTPLQISAPKGPIAREICMDVKTHLKSISTGKKLPKTVYLLYYYNLCKWDAC